MRHIPFLALTALSAAPAKLPLSGTVTAPPGGNVQGTYVIACPPKGDGCDEQGTVSTQVTASGKSSAFTLNLDRPGPYRLLAWKDVNGNGDIDDGDYLARLQGQDGSALDVQAPRAKVQLALRKVGEAPSAPAASTPAPTTGVKAVTPTPSIKKGIPGYVTGQVFNSLGRPLKGAFVTIDPAVSGYFNNSLGTFETDANGAYKARLTPEVSWKATASAKVTWQDQPMCLPGTPFGDGGGFFAQDGAVRHFKLDVNVADLNLHQEYAFSANPVERPRYIGDNNVNRFRLGLKPLGPLVDGTVIAPGETTVVATKSGGVDSTTMYLRKLPLGVYELSLSYVESDGSLTPLLVHNTGRANSGFARTTVVDFDRIIGCGGSSEVEYQFPR
ncbi:hypothetical protein [Deinococcus apachensis]|uniref:hypothetical protein n=1 Tax=Deinococcus apachensis TaxID=309886 RepID=UPI00036E36AE|nr:hypothetical protein [Deinococcus apachensis]